MVVQLPARELVVGDVILLEAGDMIPADGRLIENASLKVDESALTGESLAVERVWTLFWRKHRLVIGQICCFPEALSHMGVAERL